MLSRNSIASLRGVKRSHRSNPLYAERAQAYLQMFDVEASILPLEDNPDF
jgi:hypothetical protein